MKKVLFVLASMCLLSGCVTWGEGVSGDPTSSSSTPATTTTTTTSQSTSTKSVKITKFNCGLTGDDSTEAFTTALDIEGSTEKYEFEVGPNCYNHATYDEFLIKKDGYFKSKSTYHVEKLVIDYMSKKAITFEVLNANGDKVNSVQSEVATEYPDANDYGAVVEYPIDGNAWRIQNVTDYKPAFYSVTVIFTM